jgi:tetratricopeptide (TPR) repeat protein
MEMKFRAGFFALRNISNLDWWKCFYKYVRGIIRLTHCKSQASIEDFQWILNNGAFSKVTSLLYENLGVNYARLHDFNKAEKYLIESSKDKEQENNAHLFMWLGYVYLMKEKHEEALNYFQKSRKFTSKRIDRWVVNEQYIKKRINDLEDEIRIKYKEVLTNN